MFNFKLEIPTYKEWKASAEKYTTQVSQLDLNNNERR